MTSISLHGKRSGTAGLMAAARADLARGVRGLRPGDRWLYAAAIVLVLSGLAHLAVQVVLGGPWSGPVSWRKPVTFGFSFGITLATLTWVSSYLSLAPARRARLIRVFAGACVLEVLVITIQAWRRVPSHFNISTPVNAAFAYTAAAGGALIIVTTVLMLIASFRPADDVAPSMRLAVRTGFVTFTATLAIGAAMIVIGMVAARTQSQEAAYSAASSLKNGHAALMHGIFVLPSLAWLLSLLDWPQERQTRWVMIACTAYAVVAGAVVVASVAAV